MEVILAAGIGATATIAGAYITTRPSNKRKRALTRKERKRRQVWLLATSLLVTASLFLAAAPMESPRSTPLPAVASLIALLLSYATPIRPRWAVPAALAMLIATSAAAPLGALTRHQPLTPHLSVATIATTGALALATLVLVATLNKLRCA